MFNKITIVSKLIYKIILVRFLECFFFVELNLIDDEFSYNCISVIFQLTLKYLCLIQIYTFLYTISKQQRKNKNIIDVFSVKKKFCLILN